MLDSQLRCNFEMAYILDSSAVRLFFPPGFRYTGIPEKAKSFAVSQHSCSVLWPLQRRPNMDKILHIPAVGSFSYVLDFHSSSFEAVYIFIKVEHKRKVLGVYYIIIMNCFKQSDTS